MAVSRKDSKGRALHAREYEKADGRYEYKYYVGKDRRTITCSTLAELREREKEVTKDVLDGINPSKSANMKVNDVYKIWRDMKRGLKGNTLRNYTYMYEHFVMKTQLGKSKINSVCYSDVRIFYNKLIDKEKMQVNTLEVIQNVLYQVFDIAVNNNWIRTNPCHNALRELKKNKKTKKRNTLNVEEQKRFLSWLEEHEPTWYPIFKFMMSTGLRVGEVTGLTWDDVKIEDENNRIIDVNHNLVYYSKGGKEFTYEIHTTKTVAGFRKIPMSNAAYDAIQNQIDLHKRSQVEINGYDNFIFVNRFGNVHNQSTLNRALRRIIADANEDAMANGGLELPHISCHCLRHTFCTNLCRAGVDVRVAMALMGHTDIQTTVNIYTSVQGDMKANATDALNDFLHSA